MVLVMGEAVIENSKSSMPEVLVEHECNSILRPHKFLVKMRKLGDNRYMYTSDCPPECPLCNSPAKKTF